ncbi:hypothetical protein IQ260_29075 [Leptolyngbya cf. ectocarpi LEGE 11479]|uniref:Uncharacterized protein n=1 Tax=Leptolyngbya cf. ectocarpi LEGE 11479 TaxID=1828722 RepID=A0A929A0E5_LEPEC|nr:hypothetical protein [Leptolyngbya ectocarpi]MBE9070698.1 hypothetical protein [Leptolyngbya cf. ectocarpi LEGE 11479]
MLIDPTQGAGAPTEPPANDGSLPEYEYEEVRITLLGTLISVQNTIATLFKLNYAEPNDWSRPLPTGRPYEVMAILTRRVRVN